MNKEEIYDTEIAPLMVEIIRICKENKIAMLLSFSIPTEDEPDLSCTTALLTESFDPPPNLTRALDAVMGRDQNPPLTIRRK